MFFNKSTPTTADSNEPTFRWGPFLTNDEQAQGHYVAVSATGGGKSLNICLLQADVLSHVGKGEGYRCLIYDAKQESYPIVAASCDERLIKTFNPFDKRGVAWWISRDVDQSAVPSNSLIRLFPITTTRSHSFRPQPETSSGEFVLPSESPSLTGGFPTCFER